mmetsp:Transcript_80135/g.235705  ORF Transcript_80135/g.235705 Transcript_80135/m.235705 type:complete len:459 (-) Transcript_80135:109-1485(-)
MAGRVCCFCHRPIEGARLLQDGRSPLHFGCIDQERAWAEMPVPETDSEQFPADAGHETIRRLMRERDAVVVENERLRARALRGADDVQGSTVAHLLRERGAARSALELERWQSDQAVASRHSQLQRLRAQVRQATRERDEARSALESERQRAAQALRAPISSAAIPLMRYAAQFEQKAGRRFRSAVLWSATAPLQDGMPEFQREVSMLQDLWAEGGRGRTAGSSRLTLPPGFTLTRIEAVEHSHEAFMASLLNLDSQRGSGQARFNPGYPDPDGEKAAVLRLLQQRFCRQPGLRWSNILPGMHGCSHEEVDSICSYGFQVVNFNDNGFFGKGLHTTTYAEYACRYATGELKAHRNPPNSQGEHVILVCWVSPGMTYPISRAEDYRQPDRQDSHSQYHARRGEPARSLRNQFQSHYVCIEARHFQCMDGMRHGAVPDYDELVCQDGAQLSPAYLLYFCA